MLLNFDNKLKLECLFTHVKMSWITIDNVFMAQAQSLLTEK